MAKFLVIIELVLLVYCLVDCIQTEPAAVRTLPKPVWVLLIIVLPLFGGVGWLLAGKPERAATGARGSSWPSTTASGSTYYPRSSSPKGPDDDPDFLRSIRKTDAERERKTDAERERKTDAERERKSDAERERNVAEWEEELREQRLRDGEQPPDRPTDATS